MLVFMLSKETLNALERIIKKFIWESGKNEHRINWVGWDKLIRTKKLGGLGLRDLKIFNQAMLAKLAWSCINE